MKFFVLILSATMACCSLLAADGTGKATVVIYRNSGGAASPAVCLDGLPVAELANKRYMEISVAPGSRRFWSDPKDSIELEVEANGRYFILAEYPDQSGYHAFNPKPKLHLVEVTANQWKRDRQYVQPIDAKHLFNVSKPSSEQ